jgi:hypothetical protein
MAPVDKMTSLFMDSQVDTSSSIYQDEVAKANQRFYDQIAEVYDEVDQRRSGHIDHTWVDRVLKKNFRNLSFYQ